MNTALAIWNDPARAIGAGLLTAGSRRQGATSQAANAGLAAAVVRLTVHGSWGRPAARLRGRQLLLATPVAAVLGVTMIVLRDLTLVLIHLH